MYERTAIAQWLFDTDQYIEGRGLATKCRICGQDITAIFNHDYKKYCDGTYHGLRDMMIDHLYTEHEFEFWVAENSEGWVAEGSIEAKKDG